MRVVVDASEVKGKIKELLKDSYGFLEDGAEDIAHHIEEILEESDGE